MTPSRDAVDRSLATIADARDLASLIGAEAEAASAYWDAWSDLPIPIGDRDQGRAPEHWRTFGKRHSLLSNGPRLACNPPNAILNYLYALLEAETTLACHAVGLDPHAWDIPHRSAQPLLTRARRNGTPTRAHHAATWNDRAPTRKRRQARAAVPILPNACRDCGTYLADRRRRYCQDCRTQRWSQHAGRGRETAGSVLARLRADQRDPAHGGRAAEARGAKNAAHQRAVREWQGERPDPSVFETEILPAIRRMPITELMAVTGLSKHYASLIRLGKKVPHPRHWEALRALSWASAGTTP